MSSTPSWRENRSQPEDSDCATHRARPSRWGQAIALVALSLSSVVSGCASAPPTDPCQRIQWDVVIAERFTDDTADNLVRLPKRFEGRETWWVAPGIVAVETRGSLPGGRVSERKMWILPEDSLVFSVDFAEPSFRAVRLDRFEEERHRRARAAMVATVRLLGPEASADLDRYRGSLSTERDDEYWRIAAVPGQEWRLRPDERRRIDWTREPAIVAAFEAVSLEASRALAPLLQRAAPDRITMQPVSTGQTAVRVHYRLRRTRVVSAKKARADLPDSIVDRARRREERLADFGLLWRFWTDLDSRPMDLDIRGLRLRMESVVDASHRERIVARLDQTTDLEEMEELLHLLFVLDPSDFDKWYRAALAANDPARVLAALSVRSLRAPTSALVDELAALLTVKSEPDSETPGLFSGLTGDEVRETRSWLLGVRLWVASRRPAPEAATTARASDNNDRRYARLLSQRR